MNPDLEKIRALLGSPEGQELRAFLEAEAFQLRLVDTVKRVEHPYAQAVEFVAQEKAYRRLETILSKIGVYSGRVALGRDPRDSVEM